MTIPTSVTDVVAGGAFGIDVVKIGDLIVNCLTGLEAPEELEVTRKPLGAGYAITDAAVDVPRDFTMTVMFCNPVYSPEVLAAALLSGDLEALTQTWVDKRDLLREMMSTREIVTVQTHVEVIDNCIIGAIDPIYDVEDNLNGFIANVRFHKITQVTSEGGGAIDSALEAVGDL